MYKFDPWYGEFGWEVMTWAPYCRRIAEEHDQVLVTSFKGMKPLYDDFAVFEEHNATGRGLNYPKRYRHKGKYHKYGNPTTVKDILIHARGVRRKSAINYKHFDEIEVDAGYIGSAADKCYGMDLRNVLLGKLMDIIAGAKVVVGVSSGVMHLAMLCGTPVVVWGDNRTYFGETLEKRYKDTWTPFHVECHWIRADDWQPKPEEILNGINSFT